MKKILCMILSAVMMLTVMGLFAACGEESPNTDSIPVNSDASSGVSSDGGDANPFPEALSNVEAISIDNLNLTGSAWEFAGGLVNGSEMDQDDAQAFLTGAGGSFQFLFSEDGKVTGIAGEKSEEGTYTAVAEGFFLEIQFSGGKYYAAFTMHEDNVVMIAVSGVQPDTAVYLTLIEG